MGKIVNISSSAREEKLKEIVASVKELKDGVVEILDKYEAEGEDDKVDTLTEALDALEDAYDALNEVVIEND